jgi:hypothetical protein
MQTQDLNPSEKPPDRDVQIFPMGFSRSMRRNREPAVHPAHTPCNSEDQFSVPRLVESRGWAIDSRSGGARRSRLAITRNTLAMICCD